MDKGSNQVAVSYTNIKGKYATMGQNLPINEKVVFIALVSLVLVYSVLYEGVEGELVRQN